MRRRPFAGVVDEVTGHLLKVLPLAAKFRLCIGLDLDGDVATAMDLLHGTAQRLDRRRHLGNGADDGETSGDARALQVVRDLIAHHVGLLQDFYCERIGKTGGSLVDDDRQRRLDGVREISDMGACALDDFAVGIDQRVGLARQRRDLDWKFAFEPFGAAGADIGDRF